MYSLFKGLSAHNLSASKIRLLVDLAKQWSRIEAVEEKFKSIKSRQVRNTKRLQLRRNLRTTGGITSSVRSSRSSSSRSSSRSRSSSPFTSFTAPEESIQTDDIHSSYQNETQYYLRVEKLYENLDLDPYSPSYNPASPIQTDSSEVEEKTASKDESYQNETQYYIRGEKLFENLDPYSPSYNPASPIQIDSSEELELRSEVESQKTASKDESKDVVENDEFISKIRYIATSPIYYASSEDEDKVIVGDDVFFI